MKLMLLVCKTKMKIGKEKYLNDGRFKFRLILEASVVEMVKAMFMKLLSDVLLEATSLFFRFWDAISISLKCYQSRIFGQ